MFRFKISFTMVYRTVELVDVGCAVKNSSGPFGEVWAYNTLLLPCRGLHRNRNFTVNNFKISTAVDKKKTFVHRLSL